MKTTFTIVSASALVLLTLRAEAQTQTLEVKPGDNPQKVLDTASPGSKLVFLPGLHQHPLGRHQSILDVDKSVDIELQKGAVLKLADHQTTLSDSAEITIDHGAPKKLNDLMVRGKYDIKMKKESFKAEHGGEVFCEVCHFDFSQHYPTELGDGYIEVHHLIPLSQKQEPSPTRLEDLMLICSNCHRMVHRSKDVDRNLQLLQEHFSPV